MKFHFTQVIAHAGKDVEKRKHSPVAGENARLYNLFRNQFVSFSVNWELFSFKTKWAATYEKGEIFVADRYTTSNAVHQAAKLPPEERAAYLKWLYDIEYNKIGIPSPDLVVYLDLTPEASGKMLKERSGKPGVQHDIHETNGEFLRKSRENALGIARDSGWEVVTAGDKNGPYTKETIHAKVLKLAIPLLGI